MIRIPNEIKIGGIVYKIVKTDKFELGKESVVSEIVYHEQEIRLSLALKKR